MARTVKMAGFRPGKVPMKMVAQQYGAAGALRSHRRRGAERAFGEAVREQNLRVAGYPRIEPQGRGERCRQLEFSAVFEVYPEVDAGRHRRQPIETSGA